MAETYITVFFVSLAAFYAGWWIAMRCDRELPPR